MQQIHHRTDLFPETMKTYWVLNPSQTLLKGASIARAQDRLTVARSGQQTLFWRNKATRKDTGFIQRNKTANILNQVKDI